MANGSLRYFQYTADDGRLFGVQLDESTYENGALGFGQAITPNDGNYSGLLQASGTIPLQMRYFNVKGTDADGRTVSRRVYVGDPTAAAWLDPETFSINLLTVVDANAAQTPFAVSSAIGERRRFTPQTDTGLIDGDVEAVEAVGP